MVRVIRRSDGPQVSFQQLDGGGESEVKGEGTTGPGEVNDQVLTDIEADFEGYESESSEISEIDWEEKDRQFEEQRLPGQSYDDFLKTFPKLVKLNKYQCDEDFESDY